MLNKKVILMILDGWGIAKDPEVSAIDKANTPVIDSLYRDYPNARLEASGLPVGLPDGQMGNSEVGHMNLGAGRVVYQNLVRINMAVKDGSISENKALKSSFEYAKANDKSVHFLGLLSDGGVHSHINHLKGLVDSANAFGVDNVFVHAFTDGRDVDPKSGVGFVKDLQNSIAQTNAKLASVIGRYYAMDRDNRWERIKLAYDLLVNGVGEKTKDIVSSIEHSYKNGVTDEFIKPIVCTSEDGSPVATINDGDVVVFFNFRTDRSRELSSVLMLEDNIEYDMQKKNIHFVTMTNYSDKFTSANVMFSSENIKNTIGEVLQDNGKKQIRIAETEKYPHVTFFFSGGREQEFDGESRILCPSPKVATYDLQPQMSARCITDSIVPEIEKGDADFICLNFANPDMVGHTGVMSAAIKACETVDSCVSDIVSKTLENGYTAVVIADHGNSDCLVNADGSPNTAHTTQPVPFFVISKGFDGSIKNGKLGDISPTILKIMDVNIPKEMTGDVLV